MAVRYRVTLTEEERTELEGMTKDGKAPAKRFLNSRALLLCDASEGGSHWTVEDVAEALGVTSRTIEHLKKRFVEDGLEVAIGRKERETPPGHKRDGVKYYIISMPRKARIDYPGLTHHVMARTFDEWKLFADDNDRTVFALLLEKRILETGCRCYAWVLMDTHYHLLIHTSEKPLWQLMKPLNTDYAHHYNKKYGRRGALFADRYKSIATQDQNYLEHLVSYIHLNPFRAGVCRSIADFSKNNV